MLTQGLLPVGLAVGLSVGLQRLSALGPSTLRRLPNRTLPAECLQQALTAHMGRELMCNGHATVCTCSCSAGRLSVFRKSRRFDDLGRAAEVVSLLSPAADPCDQLQLTNDDQSREHGIALCLLRVQAPLHAIFAAADCPSSRLTSCTVLLADGINSSCPLAHSFQPALRPCPSARRPCLSSGST